MNTEREELALKITPILKRAMSNHNLGKLHPDITPASLFLTLLDPKEQTITVSISLLDYSLDVILGERGKPTFTAGFHKDPNVGLFIEQHVFDEARRVHKDFDATQFLELVHEAYDSHTR